MVKAVKILQLNKLDKQVKENIYNKLIEGDYTAEIDMHTKQKVYFGLKSYENKTYICNSSV